MTDLAKKFLTSAVLSRFFEYAKDAENWGGKPIVGVNLGGDAEDKGYLLNMKKAGLIRRAYTTNLGRAIDFTPKGVELAAANGIDVHANCLDRLPACRRSPAGGKEAGEHPSK